MSFSTYSGLQAEIAAWLDRTDLTSRIPGFIDLAHGYLNRTLRTQAQYAIVDANVGTEYLALPTDWLETINIDRVDTVGFPLDYRAPSALLDLTRKYSAPGRPRFYSIVGDRLRFIPAPDEEYPVRMEYYKQIPALSVSNTTNWLLTASPDVYLHGSLLYANKYLRDAEGMAIAKADLDEAIAQIETADERAGAAKTPRVHARVLGV